MIKLIDFTAYLQSIKGLQDTPEQADLVQDLIDAIQNDSTLKIVTDPETQDEEEWQMQMD